MGKVTLNSVLSGAGNVAKHFTPAAIFQGLGSGIGAALAPIGTPLVIGGVVVVGIMLLKN